MELSDLHPIAVIAGIIGVLVGIYMVKVTTGGGFSVGEANLQLGIFWRVLIPIACGAGGWLIVQKMADSG